MSDIKENKLDLRILLDNLLGNKLQCLPFHYNKRYRYSRNKGNNVNLLNGFLIFTLRIHSFREEYAF